jgi:hypothetical protein
MLNIADFKPKSEPPFGLIENDFVQIADLIDKQITVTGIKTFENKEGPGVFLRFEAEGVRSYTTTHSTNLVKIFGNPDLVALIKGGETVAVKIIKRPSTKDAKKTVFDVE